MDEGCRKRSEALLKGAWVQPGPGEHPGGWAPAQGHHYREEGWDSSSLTES